MSPTTPELTEDQARKILKTKVRNIPTAAGQRGHGRWFFTWDPTKPLPAGSPSWSVYDDGQCSSASARPPFSR